MPSPQVPRPPQPPPQRPPPGATGIGYEVASKTLLIIGGIGLGGSAGLALGGWVAKTFGCVESDKSTPEEAAHCGDRGRVMLYGALGVGLTSLAMLITGAVLRSCCTTATQGRGARASRLRLDSWREAPWLVPIPPAEPRPASSSGLALSLSL